jgi:polygalacturonase
MLRSEVTFMKPSVLLIFAWLAFANTVRAQPVNPALPTIPANNFNVTTYGAKGDGKTDNTTAIVNAINAAVSAGGGTVEFPAATNTYLSSSFTLYSSINLQVDAGAELQMLPYDTYSGSSSQFIYCDNVHDVEISGEGVIDGQGVTWWNISPNTPPLLLQLENCDRLFIHDITFQNAPYHHCGIREKGGNITISNLTESAPSTSPNTDGIDFVGTNCLIEDCHISVGDDNIALGSTGPLIGLVITNCTFGSGHGVSIGSTVSDGITNLTVINCSFNGTVNGIRMKCDPDASALVTNLSYLNIAMTNVQLPIVIYTYYNFTGTPDDITTADVLEQPAQPINSATPKWSGITISNLNITSGASSKIGGIIWGPVEWPISNITLVCITNNAPNTFDLYNVYGVQIINSQFNFSSGDTFTMCNAGVTISNAVPGSPVETINGASSTNSLALYNASASMASSSLLTANPITISGGVLTTTNNTWPGAATENFFLGTNSSTIAVTGNLTFDSTLNIASAGGFTATNYTLFTYTGSLSGTPVLGATPAGFSGYTYNLGTNTPGEVMLLVSPPPPPSPPSFGTLDFDSSSGNLILSGSGGATNGAFYVLSSTNIALPLNQWTLIATNQFDGSGNFIFTNVVQTNIPQTFFVLEVP